MFVGAHVIMFSADWKADRDFMKDVLKLPWVDAGEGFLIFGVPPAEVGVHESEQPGHNGKHEFYLMCDDVQAFVADMAGRGVSAAPVNDQGWGLLTQITLPGGSQLGVYQPRHARPVAARRTVKRVAKKAARKPAKRAPPRKKAKARRR